MTDLVGTHWRENDPRFVRIVEVVSVGQKVGRKTVSMDGKPGHPTRVTFGDAEKFFKAFTCIPNPTLGGKMMRGDYGFASIPSETEAGPVTNARLIAELRAVTIGIHMFGLGHIAHMSHGRAYETPKTEQVQP